MTYLHLPAPKHQPPVPQHPTSYYHLTHGAHQQRGYSPCKYVSYPDYLLRRDTHAPPASQPPPVTQAPDIIEFVKYLAHRELVTTWLTKFDDQPETFRAWESSLFNATRGLDLTVSEELDLLIKWLWKESSDQVKRIHAVYVSDTQAALHLSWARLQQCYSTPEVMQSALFMRRNRFPCLNSKIKWLALGTPLSKSRWVLAWPELP